MTNESNLIQQAKEGDRKAMTELCKGYEGLMKKAAHQAHLASVADEAMSTAWESFLVAVHTFDASRGVPFPAYAKAKVYGDLRTLFKQCRKKWQRETYPAESEDGSSFWDAVEDTRDLFKEREEKDLAGALLKMLPSKQRRLLCLLYFEDCTQKTAAAKLGITQQAAAAMKKRALRNLRSALETMRG